MNGSFSVRSGGRGRTFATRLPLACGDHSFPLLTHSASLGLISRLGFEGVSLMLWGERSHLSVTAVAGDPETWAGCIAERAAECGLVVADVMCIPGVGREMALNHPCEPERDRGFELFAGMIEFAVGVGAPGVTVLPGVEWAGESHDQSLARAAAELTRRVRLAADYGLVLSIEPNRGSICRDPSDVLRLCEEVPGLAVTLDCTHFIAEGFSDDDVAPLIAHARHVHIRGARPGRLQVPLDQSSHDPVGVVDALVAAGYRGQIAVEYFVDASGADPVDVLTETVHMRDFLLRALATSPCA